VTSQVSHPYNSTDFTQALNILVLVSFRNDLDSHTTYGIALQLNCTSTRGELMFP